jgi:N6-L-threonylcarbamoyladenine synthase
VAANSELRARFEEQAAQAGLPVHFPSLRLSTDNAAMIAAAGLAKFARGEFSDMSLKAQAGLALA